jgi:serine phosphatase RsbU (regulator of sigma subunit)
LGVASTAYESTTITMTPGSILLAYTDGLVERRTEDLDLGFQRLADAAATPTNQPLDDVLTDILSIMTGDGADDDIAILAFKWGTGGAPNSDDLLQAATSGTSSS